jgi:hypothetical protein
MVIIFFDMMGIILKEFVLVCQTANSAYYCDVLRRLRENALRLHPEHGYKRIGCCITTTHRLTPNFFTKEFFIKNNTTVVSIH